MEGFVRIKTALVKQGSDVKPRHRVCPVKLQLMHQGLYSCHSGRVWLGAQCALISPGAGVQKLCKTLLENKKSYVLEKRRGCSVGN